MKLEDAVAGRRAVREYTAQPVDEQTIRRLVAAAIQAPSAVNQQPWTFVIVRDRGRLDLISREAKAHMLATMPSGAHSEHFQSLLGDPNFHIFYHAPALVVISAKAQGPWIVEDCALAAENLMLSAFSEGLGTCWIGFAQSYLNTSEGKAALEVPDAWVSVAPIIVGTPKSAPPPVPRHAAEIRWIG
jgi:nitroreductase